MGSRADIAAGRAYVELYVKNSMLMKGLKAAKDAVSGVGVSLMKIGGAMSAAGAGIVTPLLAAAKVFADMGSELADMSARTGESVGSLAELRYAAQQTGTALSDVEKAIKFSQKSGSTETFDQIAARISAIVDPAERTRAALEAWGKAGTMLLPMVDNLAALRKEARDLNLVPSEEAVKSADIIGDLFDKIKAIGMSAAFEIGAALGPVLIPALETVKNLAVATVTWVKNNGELVRTIFKIGAGLLVVGTVIVGLGAAFVGAGIAIGGVMAAITGITAAVAFLISPVGMVTAAIVAGSVAWFKFTDSGKAALKGITGLISPIKDTIKGVMDAFAAGNMELAMKTAWDGIKVIWTTGTVAIRTVWASTVFWITQAFDDASNHLSQAFLSVADFFGDVWGGIRKLFVDGTRDMQNFYNDLREVSGTRTSEDAAKIRREIETTHSKATGQIDKEMANDPLKTLAEDKKARDDARKEGYLAEIEKLNQELTDAKHELAKDLARAYSEKAAKRDKIDLLPVREQPLREALKAGSSFTTFSVQAALGNAGKGSGIDRVAKTLAEMKTERKAQFEKEMKARRDLRQDIRESFHARP